MARRQVLCPSGRCEEGAGLFGIVQPDGRVGYLGGEIRVDPQFVAKAQAGRAPEKRFRFSNRCIEGGCRQWTGSRCGVADKALAEAGPQEPALPNCGIRAHCRWHMESGADACAVCSLVTRD